MPSLLEQEMSWQGSQPISSLPLLTRYEGRGEAFAGPILSGCSSTWWGWGQKVQLSAKEVQGPTLPLDKLLAISGARGLIEEGPGLAVLIPEPRTTPREDSLWSLVLLILPPGPGISVLPAQRLWRWRGCTCFWLALWA